MTPMNPYIPYVSNFARLLTDGQSLMVGTLSPPPRPQPPADAPVVLIFSPPPDDECIVGGLALRLLREANMRVINVAVTQGSNKARQQARLEELRRACDWLGFGLEQTAPCGLEKINPKTRANEAAHWSGAVKTIAALLARHRPRAVFFPHALDWNSTHVGVNMLVMDALRSMPADFQTTLIETEFWGQMTAPNLMVEISPADLADLVAALSLHTGEVERNPYHLRLPAWMQDNVRRGAELVGGQGGISPLFPFATLYRALTFDKGHAAVAHSGGRQIKATDPLLASLGWPSS